MVIRKPYAYLIKNFKKIHLIITCLLAFVCYKTNNLLLYLNRLRQGTASRAISLNYISNFTIFLIVVAIIGFIIIYILMRYKKKPKLIYLVSVIGYIVLIIFLLVTHSYLKFIQDEYITQKAIRAYRDLIQIGIYYQYFIIGVMLVRGLGFDIKKFDFAKDLHEFEIEEKDNEEIEVELNVDYNKLDRGVNRTRRELKYYFYENKMFIVTILGVIGFIAISNFVTNNLVFDKKYPQDKLLSVGNYEFQIKDTYITDTNYVNGIIGDKEYVVVKFSIKNNGNTKVKYDINNFTLEYKGDIYSPDTKLCKKFIDIGNCYDEQSITNEPRNYILAFDLDKTKIKNNLLFRFRYGDKVYNFKLKEKETFTKEYKLNENIDLTNTHLKDNKFKITSFNINNRFDYTYQNCLSSGECMTHNSSVSSHIGLIMELNIESDFNYTTFNLNNALFMDYYGTLKYTKEGQETVAKVTNKTSSKVKDKVYLEVDKEIQNADNIWIDFYIRGNKIKYILK